MSKPRARKPPVAIKVFKKGRVTLGGISELSDGRKVFVAYRWRKDIERDKQPTISAASAAGVASWPIDTETLRKVRREGVIAIAVFVKDNGDLYVTDIDSYFNEAVFKSLDWSRSNRSAQRCVPLQVFRFLPRPTVIR